MDPLRELGQLVRRHTGPGSRCGWEDERLGLRFATAEHPDDPRHTVYTPVFAIVVQGEKQLVVADELFTCGKGTFVVVSLELPITFRLSAATPEEPYIAVAMRIDPAQVAALLLESAAAVPPTAEVAAIGVSNASNDLLEAVLRLVRLVDQPRDLPVLGPIVRKEIMWRLLCSEQGHRLRQIGLADSNFSQIGRAMRAMREDFRLPLRIEDLARLSAMSVTSFHRHFRAATLMSPLQYLKQIRLQEARTQLLARTADVASIGHAVGYDSPSQFSREYKRAFGAPPGQDARLLRGGTGAQPSK